MRRVARPDETEVQRDGGVELRQLVPPHGDSTLALDAVRLAPGTSLDVTDEDHDTLLFVHAGSGSLGGTALSGAAAGFVPFGVAGSLVAGADDLECVRITLGAGTDLHAPMGATEPVVALDHLSPGQ